MKMNKAELEALLDTIPAGAAHAELILGPIGPAALAVTTNLNINVLPSRDSAT